jgi:hypothetical protein
MKVILIDEAAFFELFDRVLQHVDQKIAQEKKNNNWLTPEEAMKALNISSKTTLQKYRDEGKIRFAQPSRKIILYDPKSIDAFLQKHAQDTF